MTGRHPFSGLSGYCMLNRSNNFWSQTISIGKKSEHDRTHSTSLKKSFFGFTEKLLDSPDRSVDNQAFATCSESGTCSNSTPSKVANEIVGAFFHLAPLPSEESSPDPPRSVVAPCFVGGL